MGGMGNVPQLGKPEKNDRAFVPGRGGDRDPTDPFNEAPAKFGDLINTALVRDTLAPGIDIRLGKPSRGLRASADPVTSRVTLDSTFVGPANELQRSIAHETDHIRQFGEVTNPFTALMMQLRRLVAVSSDAIRGGHESEFNLPEEVKARRGAEATQLIRTSNRRSPLGFQFQIEQSDEFNPDSLSFAIREQALDLPPNHPIQRALAQQDSLRAKQGKQSQRLARIFK